LTWNHETGRAIRQIFEFLHLGIAREGSTGKGWLFQGDPPWQGLLQNRIGRTGLFSFLGSRIASDEPVYSLLGDDGIPDIASEFYRLDDPQLDQIPLSVLYHILCHPSLTISSEAALYSYLSSRLSADPERWALFQFLRFEYLPLDSISDFVSLNPESIGRCLWDTISTRLLMPLVVSRARSVDMLGFQRNARPPDSLHNRSSLAEKLGG
jgi:hypothetical protein